MKIRVVISFISLIAFFAFISPKKEKQLCVTIDDLPLVTYGLNDSEFDQKTINKFIETFKTYKIPAIGFVVERQLYANGKLDSNKVELLNTWVVNGYDLGNHTYSHYDFNKVSDSIYYRDILQGEIITKAILNKYDKELRYFRHPYLHTGGTKERSDSLHQFLVQHRYAESPVTLDDEDYLFAKAYHNAYMDDDTLRMKSIGERYVIYMEEKLVFFEHKTQELFKRDISQTLLIHASLLNADYLDELAIMYQKHGYTFVSQATVFQDKAYAEPVNFYTAKGISWIFRWAFSKGKNEEFMQGDVPMPELY